MIQILCGPIFSGSMNRAEKKVSEQTSFSGVNMAENMISGKLRKKRLSRCIL